MTTRPDIFGDVHKGIRKALFDLCLALGRADGDAERLAEGRRRAREVARFLAHHGDNEDTLLLPLLAEHAPACHARLQAAHGPVADAIAAFAAVIDEAPAPALYHEACALTALYLGHMREEELELRPLIEAALSDEDLATFGRRSVERTAPADQLMMLGYMFPAMPRSSVDAFLGRVPPATAERLRPLAGA